MVTNSVLAPVPAPVPDPKAPGPLPREVRWVRFEATIPEPLANVFSTLTPWKWRELRPFFCRYPENRRLKNIGGAIHSILEKAPHMLARGHWSVEEYIASRRRLAAEIASLAKLVVQVAGEARIQIPSLIERQEGAGPARVRKIS